MTLDPRTRRGSADYVRDPKVQETVASDGFPQGTWTRAPSRCRKPSCPTVSCPPVPSKCPPTGLRRVVERVTGPMTRPGQQGVGLRHYGVVKVRYTSVSGQAGLSRGRECEPSSPPCLRPPGGQAWPGHWASLDEDRLWRVAVPAATALLSVAAVRPGRRPSSTRGARGAWRARLVGPARWWMEGQSMVGVAGPATLVHRMMMGYAVGTKKVGLNGIGTERQRPAHSRWRARRARSASRSAIEARLSSRTLPVTPARSGRWRSTRIAPGSSPQTPTRRGFRRLEAVAKSHGPASRGARAKDAGFLRI